MLKKSSFCILFCLLMPISSLFAQNTSSINDTTKWINTPLKFVFATIKFPQQTNLEKKDIYTTNGLQTLYFFKSELTAIDLTLSVSMRQVSTKEQKKATQEEINRMAVQFGGYPNVYKEKDKNGRNYDYILIHTLEGKVISSRIFYIDGYLVILSTVANQANKNQTVVDTFFDSFTPFSSINSNEHNVVDKNKQPNSEIPWIVFKQDNFTSKFPIEPNSKTYVVQQVDSTYYLVKNFYLQKGDKSLSYLVSERNYPYQLGITADSLFKTAFDALKLEGKGKLKSETNLFGYKFPAKEYVFTSRKAYYRLRYFFANNALYQVMIAGNKKQVTDLKNEQFFQSFQILQ